MFSQLDLNVRLQLSGQKYSEWLNDYINALRYGKKTTIEIQNKLFILSVYIDMMLDYKIYQCDPTTYSNTNNCLTETEIESVFDKLSKLTGICFQPYGYKYIGSENSQGIGSMQIGCNFIVS